ncbi:MAG: ComEC/Rec2 family competence protein [Anaerolineae bacterium]|nr:ComEC/Rec2 family competence protein [Anaerolineae bacterium]
MRLVYIALGWVSGIILAATYSAFIPLFWLSGLGVMVLVTGMGWGARRGWYLLALVALFAGGYRYQFVQQTSDLAQYNTVGAATIIGDIVHEPDIRDDRIQLRVRAESINLGIETHPTDGLLLVNVPRIADVRYGDRVRITGRLNTPATYDTFSYADFLARESVFTIMDNTIVEVLATDGGNAIIRQLLSIKARLQAKIGENLPDPEAALLAGILLGNERGLDPKLNEDFTRVGAAHIIAISGFNMAIIAGILDGTLGRIFSSRKWIATLLGIVLLALYTLLVGANAAVIRAAFMSSLLLIAPLLKRKTYVPASLAAVVMVMSVAQPSVLWDISFQLSFFAVLGLALFATPFSQYFDTLLNNLFPSGFARLASAFLSEPLVVSIAALTMTLPLTMLYFQRLSIVSLLVNILVVPIQSYVLIIGGLALIVSFVFSPIGQMLFWMDYVLLSWSIRVVRQFGNLTFADVVVSFDRRLVWAFFAIIIGAAIMRAEQFSWVRRLDNLIRSRSVFTAIIVSAACLFILIVSVFYSRPDGNLHVWWLDVGHSHAVFIETPGGSQILIDGGRFPSRLLTSIGDRMPFYDRTIEIVVITRHDEFDTGALSAVLERYDAGVVLTNGQVRLSDSYVELENAIAPYDVVTVRAGYRIEIDDGTLIEVLYPTQTPSYNDNLGDSVIVLRITYGDISFLIPSDLSRRGQSLLLENGQWSLATVMALPQHGTQRSLDEVFLAAAQPQAIVLQSDIANRRGDPDRDILAMLEDTPLYRTDESGTLHFYTDGSVLWFVGEG